MRYFSSPNHKIRVSLFGANNYRGMAQDTGEHNELSSDWCRMRFMKVHSFICCTSVGGIHTLPQTQKDVENIPIDSHSSPSLLEHVVDLQLSSSLSKSLPKYSSPTNKTIGKEVLLTCTWTQWMVCVLTFFLQIAYGRAAALKNCRSLERTVESQHPSSASHSTSPTISSKATSSPAKKKISEYSLYLNAIWRVWWFLFCNIIEYAPKNANQQARDSDRRPPKPTTFIGMRNSKGCKMRIPHSSKFWINATPLCSSNKYTNDKNLIVDIDLQKENYVKSLAKKGNDGSSRNKASSELTLKKKPLQKEKGKNYKNEFPTDFQKITKIEMLPQLSPSSSNDEYYTRKKQVTDGSNL